MWYTNMNSNIIVYQKYIGTSIKVGCATHSLYGSSGPKESRVQYKTRLLLRCIHHFESDLIYNLDHMRISGTEPSSVILSQTKKVSKVAK